jgi:hypothetical protein
VQRYNANGSLDSSFNAGIGANGVINALIVLPDGKIMIGGKFTAFNNQPRANLAKLNADGSLNATTYAANPDVLSLTLDNQQRVLVGGSFTTIAIGNGQNVTRPYAARLITSAELARTRFDFDGDGTSRFRGFNAASGDWSILGNQSNNPANTRFGLSGDKAVPADFDGDGKNRHRGLSSLRRRLVYYAIVGGLYGGSLGNARRQTGGGRFRRRRQG